MSERIVGAALTGGDLTMQRRFAVSPPELWDAVTDPARRARWLGAAVLGDGERAFELEADEEMPAQLRVARCEPPRVVEARWRAPGEPDSLVTATLDPDGDGTLLTLRHRRVPPAHTVAAGRAWEAALDALALVCDAAPRAAADWAAIRRSDLEIVRELPADPERVWRAIATREGLASWWWTHWEGVEVVADVREGGDFVIRAPHQGLAVSGVYLDVEPPRRLAFSWVWSDDDGESVDEAVDIRLHPIAGGTRLVLRHTGPWRDESAADDYRQGWVFTLSALAEVVSR